MGLTEVGAGDAAVPGARGVTARAGPCRARPAAETWLHGRGWVLLPPSPFLPGSVPDLQGGLLPIHQQLLHLKVHPCPGQPSDPTPRIPAPPSQPWYLTWMRCHLETRFYKGAAGSWTCLHRCLLPAPAGIRGWGPWAALPCQTPGEMEQAVGSSVPGGVPAPLPARLCAPDGASLRTSGAKADSFLLQQRCAGWQQPSTLPAWGSCRVADLTVRHLSLWVRWGRGQGMHLCALSRAGRTRILRALAAGVAG